MSLSAAQKKQFRALGHKLNPILIISDNGLSDGLLAEAERALHDHELIKVKISVGDREDRKALLQALCQHCQAELVQSIGKVALLYRHNPEAEPRLSNVLRG